MADGDTWLPASYHDVGTREGGEGDKGVGSVPSTYLCAWGALSVLWMRAARSAAILVRLVYDTRSSPGSRSGAWG